MLINENDYWVILVAGYFIPAIIAYSRRHRSAHAIAALTLLLGWTVLGWLVAVIWSLTGNTRPARQGL